MIGISKLSPRRLLVVVLNKGGGLTEDIITSEPSVACFYEKYDTYIHYCNYP